VRPLRVNTNFPNSLRYPTHDLERLTRQVPHWKYPVGVSSVPQGQGPLARDSLTAVLEAFLMAADAPLTTRRLAALLKISGEDVKRQIKKLQALYEKEQSAFHIVELAGGYQLRTRESLLPWLLKLRPAPEIHLTPATRETLTMIAYKQPITRADLEKLRGVACGDILRALLEKGLIRIVGRDNSLGRPVLYGTSKLFLETTGLKSLQDLPGLKS
jgi:segregation and condensation protein B